MQTMDKTKSIVDLNNLISVVQRRCDDHGVTLRYDKTATTAYTDGRSITLPKLKAPFSQTAYDKLYGFVVHECGHHSRPDAFKIAQSARPNDRLMSLYNIIEDEAMERDVASQHKGDAVALGRMQSVLLDEARDAIKEVQRKNPDHDWSFEECAPVASMFNTFYAREKWDQYVDEAYLNYLLSEFPKEMRELTNTLKDEGWAERIADAETPHDTWDVSCDLYRRLYPEEDNEDLQKTQDKGHAMEEPNADDQDQDGKNRGDVCDSQDGTIQGSGQLGSDDNEEKGSSKTEGLLISWRDCVLSDHNEYHEGKKHKPGAFGTVGIDWTDYHGAGGTGVCPPHLLNVVDLKKRKDLMVHGGSMWEYGFGTPDSFLANNKNSRAFANQVRRYLQAQARTKIDREKHHGTLDKQGIVRLALPPIDGGEYNRKIFYRRTKRKELNTCIHLVTDWSGSMSGEKMKHAADATGRLIHVFDRILKVPVQSIAFTNGQSVCDIGIVKRFNERSVSPEELANRFSKFYSFTSGNNDSDAVLWAHRELQKRDEDRRIMIVLSDGAPTGSWSGNPSNNLKQAVKAVEATGIEVWGVGIDSNAVQNYYTNYKVLRKESEINPTLFNIIKDGVKKK